MFDIPTVYAKGISTQRHIDALYSTPRLFTADKIRRVKLSTGITMEYAMHTSQNIDDGPNSKFLEERLMLIMGFLQPKETWAATIDMLLLKWDVQAQQKNLKTISIDNRGTGGSDVTWWRYTSRQMAEDVLALMNHVGWDSAHIAGISMGGMISLELASIAPSRVKSLTLMVTTRGKYKTNPVAKAPQRRSLISRDPVVVAKCRLHLLYADSFLQGRVSDTGDLLYDVMYTLHVQRAEARKRSIIGMINQLLAILTHYVSDDRLRGIQSVGFPILIIGAMEDIVIPPIESITLKQIMNSNHVHTLFIERCGHGVSIQCMEEVAEALIQTFARAKKA